MFKAAFFLEIAQPFVLFWKTQKYAIGCLAVEASDS